MDEIHKRPVESRSIVPPLPESERFTRFGCCDQASKRSSVASNWSVATCDFEPENNSTCARSPSIFTSACTFLFVEICCVGVQAVPSSRNTHVPVLTGITVQNWPAYSKVFDCGLGPASCANEKV